MNENNHNGKCCEICNQSFPDKDLYPNSLIRETVFTSTQKRHPHFSKEGFVCFPDLRKISAQHFEDVVREDKGFLSTLEQEVIQSLSDQDIMAENINVEFEQKLTFGERLADRIASFGGSWYFISLFGVLLLGWMSLNTYQFLTKPFDPYPFILLNLILSCLAAIQAPIIMMSQNRQAAKDRLEMENDYQVNLKSELQVRQLNARLDAFLKNQWQHTARVIEHQEAILRHLEKR